MDEYDAREKFFKGLDLNMLGHHWLIRVRDFYRTTTPLHMRDKMSDDDCQHDLNLWIDNRVQGWTNSEEDYDLRRDTKEGMYKIILRNSCQVYSKRTP